MNSTKGSILLIDTSILEEDMGY